MAQGAPPLAGETESPKARQEAEREVQRLLEEHREQRRAIGMPPLSGEALEAVIRGFRKRVAITLPRDGAISWPHVHALQDKLRDAEDNLERAKAEVRPRKGSRSAS
jgi:hypothetical protein